MTSADLAPEFILAVACPSAKGQIAAISGFVDAHGGYIKEFAVFDDEIEDRIYVRAVFRVDSTHTPALADLRDAFAPLAERFGMDWRLTDAAALPKVLLMVSRFDHCLNDLLYRWRMGELRMEIPAIVSNHPDLAPLAEAAGVPFHHLPVSAANRAEQEAQLLALIDSSGTDLVVLARYMQILSPALCTALAGRAINIHHSFLPGFKGAKPYHQAHARGVKLIGATAHYVTTDLDEGPIIEQVVERVNHSHRPDDLLAVGRDMESLALARAVRLHIEQRVFLNGDKTVVLS